MSQWTFSGILVLVLVAAAGCSSGGGSSQGDGGASVDLLANGTENGGPSGTANACEAAAGDNACVACAKQKCCSERDACQSDSSCPSTAQCIVSCASNKECTAGCEQKAGAATFERAVGIDSCLVGSCAKECGL